MSESESVALSTSQGGRRTYPEVIDDHGDDVVLEEAPYTQCHRHNREEDHKEAPQADEVQDKRHLAACRARRVLVAEQPDQRNRKVSSHPLP
jgi:hypothetical protein